jgi:hypothetical protein
MAMHFEVLVDPNTRIKHNFLLYAVMQHKKTYKLLGEEE